MEPTVFLPLKGNLFTQINTVRLEMKKHESTRKHIFEMVKEAMSTNSIEEAKIIFKKYVTIQMKEE